MVSLLNRYLAATPRLLHRVHFALLVLYLTCATSPLVWAASKKKEEVVAETKSYTFPYILVMMILALGLMAVCRPSSRLDKVDEKAVKKEE